MVDVLEKLILMLVSSVLTLMFCFYMLNEAQMKTCAKQFEKLKDYEYCMSLNTAQFYNNAKIEASNLGR